ncbi:MAG: hypothetical protein KGI50_06585 [Patescibacteria group bacterium]|nr:hypothetical protein [Patescibacteria group bacterium]MDE2439121.1 hypothetical protein [Patescibacteria group bacterium]
MTVKDRITQLTDFYQGLGMPKEKAVRLAIERVTPAMKENMPEVELEPEVVEAIYKYHMTGSYA